MQEILSNPVDMRRFLSEEESCLASRVLARQLDLSQAASDTDIANAIASPENWELKLQGESGVTILHDEELAQKLRSSSAAERSQYVLMERARPTPQLTLR